MLVSLTEEDDVQFLERHTVDPNKSINMLFRCKDCLTIFDGAHILEMYRFTQEATNDPLWPILCRREQGDHHCSDASFQNLTKLFEANVQLGIMNDGMI